MIEGLHAWAASYRARRRHARDAGAMGQPALCGTRVRRDTVRDWDALSEAEQCPRCRDAVAALPEGT